VGGVRLVPQRLGERRDHLGLHPPDLRRVERRFVADAAMIKPAALAVVADFQRVVQMRVEMRPRRLTSQHFLSADHQPRELHVVAVG